MTLLRGAEAAEQAYRRAQALAAPAEEQYELARRTGHRALTDATAAAYAAQRAKGIGPQGYEDRIYRRKAIASTVHAWTPQQAERCC